MQFIQGIGALILTLAVFSAFSLKCPKGDEAMGGLANAAIASFLVEAIFKYILGDFAGVPLFAAIGGAAGSLGGTASAILVSLAMGTDPVFAVAGGLACSQFGILPGFLAAYAMHFALRLVRKIPAGLDVIAGALLSATGFYLIAHVTSPGVTAVIATVGGAITEATHQSPLLMGFVLGGIMKIVCTSPLSSMALTAMLGLTGLPMGIACTACFGGAFSNAVLFHRLHLGGEGSTLAVILEPLTQADTITRHPIPIYASSFLGGSLSGIAAVTLGIVCDAPGTASTIPGLLAPFAFNDPARVILAMGIALMCGLAGGWIASMLFKPRTARVPAAVPGK